ncbi:hypothetical protein M427DRAFT_56253 [Gonapodya prolifera JEL478]|uniref:MFS general substrate transporter n=1 Tax=Gonapodya prolifera (strain JEL478) TaxID=1344416 RepID=A0A139AHB2_GONPJ|nr:hypothetical protein M427DRAFT_56253 [Gonapodya prolifera JEL478]|eukprot:KXS15954.1 hypothetical protein M427DRAFT_56253 [Gonapodya prolifera JEL478]
MLTPWGKYGLLFLGSVNNGIIPIIIGLSTITTKGATRTAVRSAFTVACGNVGGAIGSFIYQTSDGPLFIRGHYINASLLVAVVILFSLAVWSIWREGEYVGMKANLTVFERGGIELEGNKWMDMQNVLRAGDAE